MSSQFFTILKTYFQCCANRCSYCFNKKEEDNPSYSSHDILYKSHYSQFSFDDLSNPKTPGTPMSWSSSSSSLESYNNTQPYKRPQFKPYIGIIPANYYSD